MDVEKEAIVLVDRKLYEEALKKLEIWHWQNLSSLVNHLLNLWLKETDALEKNPKDTIKYFTELHS
jgi:hypothetical protein